VPKNNVISLWTNKANTGFHTYTDDKMYFMRVECIVNSIWLQYVFVL